MEWIFLIISIIFEVVANTFLKLSNGFTKPFASVIAIIGYGVFLVFLSLSMKKIPISIAYSIWAAGGIIAIFFIGIIFFQEGVSVLKISSLILIVIGIIGLKLGG